MKKIKMLLSALLALCLVFCLPDVLALDDSATPENSPEVVGWLPEQVGSWVGFHENLWEQYTFYKNGKYDLTVFEDPSLDCRGSFETIGKADSVTIDGDPMLLTVRGITSTFRRLLSPYIRLRMEESAYIPSVDRTLVGTWGGRMDGEYVEWTFREDGRFTRITPYEILQEEGHYLAAGGELAILLNRKILQYAYVARESFLTVDLPNAEKLILNKKTGQLTEVMVDEDGDFGWLWRSDMKGLRGPFLYRYLDSETEVGTPGAVAMSAVLGIGEDAFKGNKTIQSITIPTWVTQIGRGAFERCEKLKDVLFIGTRTEMGAKVWRDDLSSYRRVGVDVIPGSCPLKIIGEGTFRGCKNLVNLNVAQSAAQSSNSIYYWIGRCDISGVNLPDGLESIGASAFEGCESITSMTVPASVKEIGKDAFKGCSSLTLIVTNGSYAHLYAKNNMIPYMIKGE